MYCGECGSEIDSENKFCPECGAAVDDASPAEESGDGETAACRKCDEQISVDADRCPECGFEPGGSGILSSLFSLLCVPWLGAGVLLYIGAVYAVVTSGYSVVNFIIALILISIFTVIPAANLYAQYANAERKPTEPLMMFGQEID